MKYTPHTAHGCMILSAIDEISHVHAQSIPEDHAVQVKAHVEEYISNLEANKAAGLPTASPCDSLPSSSDESVGAYKVVNQCAADLLYQWLCAQQQGETSLAVAIENRFDKLVINHPFPYAKTKSFFKEYSYPPLATTSEALKNYRKPNGDTFGVVEHTVSETAKIGIIGDWGTGTDDAKYLLKQMLLKAPDMEAILHLGDIYQSATAFECEQNFLKPIRDVFADPCIIKAGIKRIPIFTIPGNHEYFSGAKSYFEMLDVLNAELDDPKWKQEASFFCLRSANNSWQFLGADTGLGCIEHPEEPGLLSEEASWHHDRMNEFEGKTIFMTHHQFVSADSTLNHHASSEDLKFYNKRLLPQFKDYLNQIDLWVWGHNHWFLPYINNLTIPNGDHPQPILQRGQLLGGSAREHNFHSSDISVQDSIKIKYKNSVQTKLNEDTKKLEYILPITSGDGKYSDHTYGIFDLGEGSVSYYQTGAWDDSEQPNETAPSVPLHVEQL